MRKQYAFLTSVIAALLVMLLAPSAMMSQAYYDSHDAWKIRGKAVSTTAPTNGQTLVYNSTTRRWEPGAGGGATAGTGITVVGSTVSADTAVMQSRATEQAGTSTYCRSTTGNDSYTCSLTPTLTAYTSGSGCLLLNADTANTGAATINVDALGAKSILGPNGGVLANVDIPANKTIQVCYDGTQFLLMGGVTTKSLGVAVGDPAGSALATGVLGYLVAAASCTIVGWDIVVDSGTATVDVWKVATGTAKPTVANTITAAAKPAISTGTAIASTTLTGWTTTISAGDILGFNLDATSGPKFLLASVRCR